MKTSSTVSRPRPGDSDNTPTRATERPLRICVVFDEDASARSAEVFIRHVASDYQCDTQSFRFDDLDAPASGVTAARSAAGTDIMVLAARGDRMLPAHIRLWLGLCLGLRDEDQDGALVALITEASGTSGQHSSLVEYLETVAIIGGLAFFPQKHRASHNSPPDPAPSARRQVCRPGLNSGHCNDAPANGRANHGN
jgi:hypothetical protein